MLNFIKFIAYVFALIVLSITGHWISACISMLVVIALNIFLSKQDA